MDTRRMTDSVLKGEMIARQADFDYLVEHAKQEEIEALTKALGIEDWGTVKLDDFNAKITELGENGTLARAAEQIERMNKAREKQSEPAKALPHIFTAKKADGVYHYTSEHGADVAVMKEGDSFFIYDYNTKDISNPLSLQEINKFVRKHYVDGNAKLQNAAALASTADIAAQSESDTNAETKNTADSTNIEGAVGDLNKAEGIRTADFIEEVNRMVDESKRSKRKKRIGVVSETHARLINKLMKSINPEFSANGYELWIDGTGASHIEIRHGKNGEADKSMATREAKTLIPWAAQNADDGKFIIKDGEIKLSDRFFNGDGSRAPEIRLEKISNGDTIYVSECVPDAINRRIYITSAYIEKGSKGQLLNMNDTSSPQPTPEASFDSNATTDSIPDSAKKINPSEQNSSEKISSYEKLKALNEEVARFAEENIRDYKKLSEPNRRAVRAVIRQAKTHGLSDADIKTVASVAAHSGAKIKFSKADCKRKNKKGEIYYVDGFYDIDTDTI
jgi:hypothetical protein